MWKFLQKLKNWFLTKKFIFEEEITPVSKAITTLENQRDAETRKRVAAAFKAQEKQMQARAMKAHDAKCEDPLACTKTICYVWQPDEIVKDEKDTK